MDVLKNSENTLTIFVPKISFSRKFRQGCVFSASTIVDRYRGQTSQNEVKLGGHAPCEVRGPSDAIPGLPRQFGQA